MTVERQSWATDDVLVVPVPLELAAEFIAHDAGLPLTKRSHRLLQLGTHNLGQWRIDNIASQIDNGFPRVLATLRRVYPE